MRGYELVFITEPSLEESKLSDILNKFKKNIIDYGGKLAKEHIWGRRRLAYEISGHEFGIYHVWYFTGTGETVDELKRQFGYSDEILRNQIIKIDDIDAEASFLQSLIPEKDENTVNSEKTGNDSQVKSEETRDDNEETLNQGDSIDNHSIESSNQIIDSTNTSDEKDNHSESDSKDNDKK